MTILFLRIFMYIVLLVFGINHMLQVIQYSTCYKIAFLFLFFFFGLVSAQNDHFCTLLCETWIKWQPFESYCSHISSIWIQGTLFTSLPERLQECIACETVVTGPSIVWLIMLYLMIKAPNFDKNKMFNDYWYFFYIFIYLFCCSHNILCSLWAPLKCLLHGHKRRWLSWRHIMIFLQITAQGVEKGL